MIRVTVGNSLCRVEGLPVCEFKGLREVLSYSVPQSKAFFSGGHRPTKRYLMDRRGTFPTGLLYLVRKYFEPSHVRVEWKDNRKRPEARQGLFTLSLGHTPYPEQKAAAEACQRSHRGIVVAPTGVGKSLICALIINALQVPTLIVVPSLELKRQLTESLRDMFGPGIVGSFGNKYPNRLITVENVDALDSAQKLEGYDCVIIDEFHHSGAATYRKLNQKAWTGVYYKFGLTATPFRSRDEERLLLESVLSEVIYRVDYATAVENDYIVPMEAYYFDLPQQKCKGTTWAAVYSELVVKNEPRNKLVADLICALHEKRQSCLTLVKEIAHGNTLQKLTGAAFAHGQAEDGRDLIRWFSERQLTTLIGTTGVVGEGVDTRPAEWIILAGGGKSKNQFMQQCGRGFRRYPGKTTCKVILFRDSSNKWLLDHFKAQCRYLREEYGVEPVKLPVPEGL